MNLITYDGFETNPSNRALKYFRMHVSKLAEGGAA